MANNQNDNSGAAAAAGFVLAGFLAIAAFIFAVGCFVAFVMTFLCLMAWNERLAWGKFSIEPHEARAFICRGVAGAILVPAFAVFCIAVFKVRLNPDIWSYLVLGGYAAGSLGVEFLMHDAAKNEVSVEVLPPQPMIPPPQNMTPPKPREPFTFASWDDEEDR